MSSSDRTQISLRVPNAMIESFERIAEALDRDRTWVMLQAFQAYLDRDGVEILSDAAGEAALDRGETVEWSSSITRIDEAISRGTAAHVKKVG